MPINSLENFWQSDILPEEDSDDLPEITFEDPRTKLHLPPRNKNMWAWRSGFELKRPQVFRGYFKIPEGKA